MQVEKLDLHGLGLDEALEKVKKNLKWCLEHAVDLFIINHGKGYHSKNNVAVIKTGVRKYLKQEKLLKEHGYVAIYGESNLPVALTFDEGVTLVMCKGLESRYLGGQTQQEKNLAIFSEDAKKKRKTAKKSQAMKRNKR